MTQVKTFNDWKNGVLDFLNQAALLHRVATSQEDWEQGWTALLEQNGMSDDPDMAALAYTPRAEAANDAEGVLKAVK